MFGSKKDKEKKDESTPQDSSTGTPQGTDSSAEPITVTDRAKEKIVELIENAQSPVLGVRVIAEGTSPMNPEFSLAFVQEGEAYEDDTIVDCGAFNIYIDAESLPLIKEVELDFVTTGMGGGFRIEKRISRSQVEGPLAEKLQRVIDEQINPALQLHGGYVQLIDVKDTTAYIELGGGCKGCGMVDVTLKQGIEVMIKQHVPEITEVLDTTDHASGTNPYYQPSK
ncbi:MAG: iron-sulfur cluster assembly accessory protein [Calditrichaeota bacterium]|nr:MAG: iron-sulfur cluster assembly accessory protein [Calditrichota bacterium]